MNEFLRAFWRSLLFMIPLTALAVVLVQFVGLPQITIACTIFLAAALSVAARRSVYEGTLRRVANRPRRTMTPEDYRRTRELEKELGWEPSEPLMPVSAPPAAPGALAAGTCPSCGEPADGVLARQCFECEQQLARAEFAARRTARGGASRQLRGSVWSTSGAGTCTCPPGAGAPVGVRVYADGSPVIRYCGACGKRISEDEDRSRDRRLALSPVETEAERAALHFAQLAGVGQEFCPSYCPICAPRLAARVVARHGPGVIAGDDYFTPDDIALMRSGAIFGADATVTLPSGKKMTGTEIQRWIENDQAQQWIDKGRRGSGE